MFSVPPEAASTPPYRGDSSRGSRPDSSPGSDEFGSLVDTNVSAASGPDRPPPETQRRNDGPSASDRPQRSSSTSDVSDRRPVDSHDSSSAVASDPRPAKKPSRDHGKSDEKHVSDGKTAHPDKTAKDSGSDKSGPSVPNASDLPDPTAVVMPASASPVPAVPVAKAEPSGSGAAGPLTIAATAIAVSAKAVADAAANAVTEPGTGNAAANAPTMAQAVEDAANEIAATNFAVAKAIQTSPAAPAKLIAEGGAQPQIDPQLLSVITPAKAEPEKASGKMPAATVLGASAASLGNAEAPAGSAPAVSGPPPQPGDGNASAVHPPAGHNGPHLSSAQSDGKNGSVATTASPSVPSSGPNRDTAGPAPTQVQFDPTAQIANIVQQPQIQPPAMTAIPVSQMSAAAATGLAVPMSGLAVQIAANAQGGRSRFEIRLDPAELGRIDVRLDVDRHGQVTSHLIVEKPETLSMLRQDAPQLQRALQDAGLKTGNNGLQFSLRDQSSSGNNSDHGSRRNSHRLIVGEIDGVSATAASSISYSRFSGVRGGLDIRV